MLVINPQENCCTQLLLVGLLLRHNSGGPDLCYERAEAGSMTVTANTKASEARPSPWLGFVKFLLLAMLVGLIFLLAQSMVEHRFFRGGWVDQRDVLKP